MNHQQRRFLFPQRERIVRLDCVSRFGRTAHPIRTARTARVVAAVVLSCVMTVVLVGCYEPAIGLLVAPPADSVSKEEPGKIRLPLFTGWEKPALTIVVSGRQNGYIEPCGCAGLTNQKGGMARRYTLIRQLEERGWPVVPVDVGNQIKRFGRQSEIKFQIAYEALKKMGYQAIGLGPDDLRLSSGELFASITEEPSRFVSANVAVLDRDATPRFRIVQQAGMKIGVTSVLADELRGKLQGEEIITEAAEKGLQVTAAALAKAGCDLQVLMVSGTLPETRAIAKRFPQFQLVITTGGGEEPEMEPEVVAGTSNWIVQVGGKGMYAGVIGIWKDARRTRKYQRVPLDDRFADSPEMLTLLEAYQDQLESAGLDELVRPLAHPSGATFVGSAACADCHTKAMAVWQDSPHAHATDSLVKPQERSTISRHHDPECLSCHVTGWDPQRFVPFKSGYASLKSTPQLKQSGCENCHGPGSAHVAAERGAVNPSATKQGANKVSDAQRQKLRLSMQLPLAKARQRCLECHDMDNSPAFHKDGAFEEYWQQVAHPGKD
ncbi:MAG: multiheme c-type cytochrome [Planctomycetota bacterium]